MLPKEKDLRKKYPNYEKEMKKEDYEQFIKERSYKNRTPTEEIYHYSEHEKQKCSDEKDRGKANYWRERLKD